MRFLLLIMASFVNSTFSLTQSDSLIVPRHSVEIQYSSLNFAYFGGNLFLGNYFYKLNERHRIGISSGLFYHQNKSESNKIMKYSYIPVFLTYKLKINNSFLKLDLGTNILSFFDSDYYVLYEKKSFWPKHDQITVDNMLPRNKHFIIASSLINFRLKKGLYLLIGPTFYFGNKNSFSNLNIGLSYRIR